MWGLQWCDWMLTPKWLSWQHVFMRGCSFSELNVSKFTASIALVNFYGCNTQNMMDQQPLQQRCSSLNKPVCASQLFMPLSKWKCTKLNLNNLTEGNKHDQTCGGHGFSVEMQELDFHVWNAVCWWSFAWKRLNRAEGVPWWLQPDVTFVDAAVKLLLLLLQLI